MRRLGIGYGNVKYASVVGNNTVNTATGTITGTTSSAGTTNNQTPLIATLAEGAIAIYGVRNDGAYAGKLELITTSISIWSIWDEFIIYQGGKNSGEMVKIGSFKTDEFKALKANAYIQPTYQIAYLGWNGYAGALNNVTTVAGDTTSVGIKQRMSSVNPIFQDSQSYDAGVLGASYTGYQILCPIMNNINSVPTITKQAHAFIVAAGSTADFTGTATIMKFTKGSTTVGFYDNALAASTGSVAVGDLIAAPSQYGRSFSFTASALGSNSGNHVITIGTTTYTVADAGTAGDNATAIATAINAGTQATAAVSSTTTVTITYKYGTYGFPPIVYNDNASAQIAVSVVTGDDVPTLLKAAATVSAAASFELDYAWEGETGFAIGGTTEAIHCGIYTVSGSYGLKVVGYTFGVELGISSNGILDNATVSYGTCLAGTFTTKLCTTGNGTYAQVADMEKQAFYWRGGQDTAENPNKSPVNKYAVTGKTYDIYNIVVKTNYEAPFGFSNKTGNNISNISVAFETGYTSAGDNQKAFDDIINAIATAYSVPVENSDIA